MAGITALREGLGALLAGIPGLQINAFAPDRVSVPAVAVELSALVFDRTFGPAAVDEYTFTVRVYASRADDRAGQARLDSFLDPAGSLSVKAALESDVRLGGIAEALRVIEVGNYGVYEVGGTAYYGAEFTLTVWARRS